MHILLIHQAFAELGEPGGTRHHELARQLVIKGHQVTVLAGQVSYLTGERVEKGWLQKKVDDVGVTIWRCYTYPSWHRSFVHRVLSFFSFTLSSFLSGLQVRNVDLVWGTSPPIFQVLTAWLLARLKGARFLFEVRDLWPYFAVAVGVLRNSLLIRLSEWLERFLYRRADHIILNSPGFVDHVERRGARSVDIVPNGVDITMFNPRDNGESFRRLHGLEDKILVIYAGAHGMSNDLGVVLEAAEYLQENPRILFVFLGDGKEKINLMATAKAKNLKNVRFLPPVPKVEIPSALAAADLCLALLKPIEAYKTTYPNKVFDYMAAGRAVVLAIDGEIREVLEKAGAGVAVQPGDPEALADAIRTLADKPEQRQQMGLAGHDYVRRNFDRPSLARKLLLVMEKMVGGNPSNDRENRLSEDD
jgi:glycosyltransferase involved in cell wall biosynthesis